jgi:hypothetical protein
MCFSPFVFHYNHYITLRAEVNIQNAQNSGKIFVQSDEINHLTKSAAGGIMDFSARTVVLALMKASFPPL